jgi:hypothetical protein
MKQNELLPQVQFGVTKAHITDMVNHLIAQLHDGEHFSTDRVLQVAENLSAMMDFSKKLKEDDRFRKLVRDTISLHGKEYVSGSGAKIVLAEAGVEYDYSSNAEWFFLEEQILKLREKQKKIEKKMRTIPEGMVLVDEFSGETWQAPLKKSTSTFTVTLKPK